jgi:hypothetical protein
MREDTGTGGGSATGTLLSHGIADSAGGGSAGAGTGAGVVSTAGGGSIGAGAEDSLTAGTGGATGGGSATAMLLLSHGVVIAGGGRATAGALVGGGSATGGDTTGHPVGGGRSTLVLKLDLHGSETAGQGIPVPNGILLLIAGRLIDGLLRLVLAAIYILATLDQSQHALTQLPGQEQELVLVPGMG